MRLLLTILVCNVLLALPAQAQIWQATTVSPSSLASVCGPGSLDRYVLSLSDSELSVQPPGSTATHRGKVAPDGTVLIQYESAIAKFGTVTISGNVRAGELRISATGLGRCFYTLQPVTERSNAARAATGSQRIDICDQTISYDVTPPAADVPTNIRAFSGVWVGGFGNPSWCHVLIVQSVAADGTASVKLGNSRNDRWRVGKPQNAVFPAKIAGNTLTITRNHYRAKDEYTITGANSMDARFYVEIYVINGSFTRR